jgi:hypothetical protein
MQMIASRFNMPLAEMQKHAKELSLEEGTMQKLEELVDIFKLAADLTNKSQK